MKKLFTILLSLGLIVGCSSTDEEPNKKGNGIKEDSPKVEEPMNIEVVESGFTQDGDYFNYGVKIHNPNKTIAIMFPSFRITSYDETGAILSSEEQTLSYIDPNSDVYFGALASSNGNTPAKVEITPIPTDEYNFVSPKKENSNNGFEITNTNVSVDEYGYSVFTGEVTNTSKYDADQLQMVLILRNNDKIVYGTTSYVDGVQSGVKVPFEISNYNMPQYTSYEIYAYRW